MDRRRLPPSFSSSSSSSPPSLVQSSSCTHGSQDFRYNGRVRMRKWLVSQVSSGRYIGLKWIDKDKTLLRIPWKHGSRSGWSVEDGKLFKSWAIQSGKFDSLHPNARKWKANFRCALRSLPDIEEVKNLSHKTGKDAYKVFRFLPEKQGKRSYKSSRSWRQHHSKSTLKSSAKEPSELAATVRPQQYTAVRPEIALGRKLLPTEILHPVVSFPGPSLEDHRRLCYPLGVPPDLRGSSSSSSSSSRFWFTQPSPSVNFCSSKSDVISSVLSTDLGSFRNQLPPLPSSASLGFSVGPFEELSTYGHCPNSFGPLRVDPLIHAPFISGSLGSEPYSASNVYSLASGDYGEMTAHEAPYFNEFSSQPQMTDISNISNVCQWPNATENFVAEVFDVMQVPYY